MQGHRWVMFGVGPQQGQGHSTPGPGSALASRTRDPPDFHRRDALGSTAFDPIANDNGQKRGETSFYPNLPGLFSAN